MVEVEDLQLDEEVPKEQEAVVRSGAKLFEGAGAQRWTVSLTSVPTLKASSGT